MDSGSSSGILPNALAIKKNNIFTYSNNSIISFTQQLKNSNKKKMQNTNKFYTNQIKIF